MSEPSIRASSEQKIRSLTPEQRRSLERLLAEKRTGIPRVPRDAPLALSFAQNRLWFLEQLEGHTGAYNVPMAWRLRGALDTDALDRALNSLVRRHELLRTQYPAGPDGLPRAVIRAFQPMPSSLVELSSLPDREARLVERVSEERTRRFALATDNPIRWSIVRMAPDDHVLVLGLHHIAVDGWALGVLTRELWASYQALAAGRPPPLPELTVQYADVAAWQRAQLGPARMEALAQQWGEAIGDASKVVDLSPDHPRPAVQSFKGRVHRFDLDAQLVERVKLLSRGCAGTPFMVYMAAWATLIARRSGQHDFLVGTPIANRTTRESEQLVGCFINTLALRARPSADKTFRQLLAEVRQTAVAGYERQDFPFEQLVERFQPGRSLSHAPLFQSMLIVQNAPPPQFEVPGLALEHVPRPDGVAMFDLTLTLTEWGPRGMQGQLEYATDLFTPETAGRIGEHFEVLLRAAVERPDTPLAKLPMLAASERRAVVETWNATERVLDDAQPPIARILARASATPDAPAIVDGAHTLSYRDLERRSGAVAAALSEAGVARGDRVGVHLDRSADVVAALLAVWRVGAAYVPLDPAFPAARLAQQCETAGIRVAVTTRALEQALPETVRRVCSEAVVDAPSDFEDRTPAFEDIAYVLFTSGSTGRPKGVEVPHRALANFLESMAREPGIEVRDRWLAVTTISFDIAGLELFLPLLTGATIILASRADAQDGRALMRLIDRSAPTIMQATPATWRMLFEAGWTGRSSLRILVGGEALAADLCDRLIEAGREVWNLYGPTETTIWSTCARLTRARDAGPPTIGRPIANTRVYVVDDQLQPTPIGVPGRLMIGGAGVARGYHAQPELTAERFIASPFVADDRLYDTGDRARWRCDGTLEFLGRDDQQVKVRGFRIELGEIEAVLGTHPGVARGVAHVHRDAHGEAVLVGYVVPSQQAPEPEALRTLLRTLLRTRLPEYMVPAAWVMLPELPLTANGKVDRKRLPQPAAPTASAASAAPPKDGLERTLLRLFADVLDLHDLGTQDNFFDLGGHSLLAVRLLDKIERDLGRAVSLMELFRAPTIAALASVIRGSGQAASTLCLEPLRPEGARPPVFFIGSTPYARRLLPHLGDDQPVYGLNLFGLFQEDRAPEALSLDEVASIYAREIREAQPRGPYRLLAYCADAVMAYVLATHLVELGEEVEFLGFIDFVWGVRHVTPRSARVLLENLVDFGPSFIGVKLRRRLEYHRRNLVRAREQLGARARAWLGAPIPLRERHAEVIAAYYRAVSTYRARPFDGDVTLFLSREERKSEPGRLQELVSGGVSIREVPGYHDAMFDSPNAEALGRLVRTALDDAAPPRAAITT